MPKESRSALPHRLEQLSWKQELNSKWWWKPKVRWKKSPSPYPRFRNQTRGAFSEDSLQERDGENRFLPHPRKHLQSGFRCPKRLRVPPPPLRFYPKGLADKIEGQYAPERKEISLVSSKMKIAY